MAHAVYGAGGPFAEQVFVDWTGTYADGATDLDKARHTFQSCVDTFTGWPTLDRIVRDHCKPSADEDFPPDLGEAPEPPVEYPPVVRLTDEYILDRLLPDLRGEMAYVAGGWLVWNDQAWVADRSKGRQAEMVLRKYLRPMALDIDARAAMAPSKEEAKSLRGLARKLQSVGGITGFFKLCSGPLVADINEFDRDPYLLNTPAGVVNLTTGKTRPAQPSDKITRLTQVGPSSQYVPAEAPHWENFLDHLCGGDPEIAAFLQRYMGYCLTGEMGEKKFMFAWGSDSNTGKSTFVNAVRYALGTYARTVDVDVFMGKRSNTDSLAQLPGVRLVCATEPGAGQKWDDKLVKAITGGDEIEARKLYESNFSFAPQFKMLIAGNHEPELKHVDRALLKRVQITPMNNVVAVPDRRLGVKLESEASHILQWMIEGTQAWLEQGLNPPAAVTAATEHYHETEDTIAEWLAATCDLGEDYTAFTTDLYASWAQWNRSRGVKYALTSIPFGRELTARSTELGIEKYRTKRARGFRGIRLTPRVALGTEEFDA
jgi:putative DNA primase/helicase